MRGTVFSGFTMLVVALVLAVVLSIGLYVWDVNERAAEASLRPAPVAPLAQTAPTATPPAQPAQPGSVGQGSSAPPLPPSDVAAGRQVFIAACNQCHPSAGAGIGPALFGSTFAQRYPEDAPVVAVIRQGKGGMAAFAPADLSDADVANVVAYLRALGTGAATPEPTPTPRPRPGRG